MTFEEKSAGDLVVGDQIVERDGSRLARAQLTTVRGVERTGTDIVVTFGRGHAPMHFAASARVVVLPKVERVGWWEHR